MAMRPKKAKATVTVTVFYSQMNDR